MKKFLLSLVAYFLSFTSFSQTIVADYDFSSGTAMDHSGNGLHGTLHGGIISTAGQSGNPNTGLKFDGNTGYIEVLSNPLLDLTSWSITAHVKFHWFYGGDCQGNAIVFRSSTNYAFSPNCISMMVSDQTYDNDCSEFNPSKETVIGLAAENPSSIISSTTYIDTSVWYCLTATYGHDTMRTYIDGILDDVVYWPNQYSGYPSSASLYIGATLNNNYPYWFNGVIDHLTIWNGGFPTTSDVSFCDYPNSVKDIQIAFEDKPYPNPTTSTLHVPVIASTKNVTISILSSYGVRLQIQSFAVATGKNEVELSTSTLSPGAYLIEVNDTKGRRVNVFTKL